jgi:hypothetical protein
LKGVGNPRVRLESEKVGGKRYTTAGAIARFLAALNRTSGEDPATDSRRLSAILRAENELDTEGIA